MTVSLKIAIYFQLLTGKVIVRRWLKPEKSEIIEQKLHYKIANPHSELLYFTKHGTMIIIFFF